MIQDCKEKLFDMIFVWKLDRFSRNRYDSIIYKHTLRKNGVRLVLVNEPISDGAETITLNDIEAALAEAENGSDLVSFGVHQTEFGNGIRCTPGFPKTKWTKAVCLCPFIMFSRWERNPFPDSLQS